MDIGFLLPDRCLTHSIVMPVGRIVDAIRSKAEYDAVLYVGDGTGDFCPSTRLTRYGENMSLYEKLPYSPRCY
jgi:hypothetical protein